MPGPPGVFEGNAVQLGYKVLLGVIRLNICISLLVLLCNWFYILVVDGGWFYLHHRGVDIMWVLFVMMFLVLVLMAVVVIPAYPTITAADLVMLMGVVMSLVMVRREVGGLEVEVVLVRMVKGRGDQLCFLLVLVHVNIDRDILGEVARDQDVDIVYVNPHIVLGMCALDLLKRIARCRRVTIDPLLRAVSDHNLLSSMMNRTKMLPELPPVVPRRGFFFKAG